MRSNTRTIHVTAEHIANGVQKVAGWCPLALAVKAATGEPIVLVQQGTIVGKGWYANVPREIWMHVQRFDEGYGMHPMTFEMTQKGYGRETIDDGKTSDAAAEAGPK
jgi:hypothetical protein